MVVFVHWLRVSGLFLVASAVPAQQYTFVPVANSPKNIERIIEDKQGRLWMSTHDDVLCFDGSRFFSLRDFGLPSVGSYGLTADTDGGILSGSESGVYRFAQGRLDHLVSGLNVKEIVLVAPGLLLVAVLERPVDRILQLYRIRAATGAWEVERLARWKSGNSLSRDHNGTILTGCPGGWCELPSKLIADWNPGSAGAPVFHKSGLDIERVVRDRFGCLWFRSIESGSYQCPGGETPMRLPADIAGRNVWAGEVENDDGSMLFANVGSLAIGRPGGFRSVTPASGLPPVAVTSAIRGRDGSIWVGSISGLYRFPYPFRLEQWKSRHGLVWSLARAGERIVAGTSAGVAYRNRDGDWTVFRGSRKFGSISSVLPDPKGSIFAVVAREGVIELSPDGSLAARTPPGQGERAEKLAQTADGRVWLAGGGIYRVRKSGRSLSLGAEDLPGDKSAAAYIAVAAPAGDLWGCSAVGLMHNERGAWRLIAGHGELVEKPCISLAVQSDGDVWLGYSGLHVLELVRTVGAPRDRVRRYQGSADAGDAVSFFLGVDSRGWIWRGSSDGIYTAEPGQAQKGVWLPLNETDGLTDVNANHGSYFSDSDGSVWWAAQASIVHFYPPSDLVNPASPPPVFLSAFSVNRDAPRLAEAFGESQYGKNLMAHVGSLQFARRNAIRIRYRLLPEQREWRESRVLDLDLGSPTWGTHTLEFQSRFSMGQWSPTLRRTIAVLRPWWFSWQAILAFAGIGFGGTAGGAAWRRTLQARANTHLPDLSAWRIEALAPESQWVGTTLDGRYEVQYPVARGGFATVLKGRDLHRLGRPCAIKIFRHDVIDKEWLARRFQQEVSALEQLRHPSVVQIYGHGLTPAGAPFLVMEFIEGGTLRNLLDAGALSPKRASNYLRQAAGALEQIHAHGIYHRDLKPENFMIRAGAPSAEELVLIDFSIAIVKEPDQTIHGLSRAAGTIYYMAPEQAVGFATPASDIYSLAKILLEMLTGKRLSELLPNATLDLPDRVREFARSLPLRFSEESLELLGAALEFDPSRRPQDAKQFAEPIVRDLFQS